MNDKNDIVGAILAIGSAFAGSAFASLWEKFIGDKRKQKPPRQKITNWDKYRLEKAELKRLIKSLKKNVDFELLKEYMEILNMMNNWEREKGIRLTQKHKEM